MTTPLLPQAFWFRVAPSCRRVENIPRSQGRLLDLDASCELPDFNALNGDESWIKVRAGYNAGGLGLTFEITGKVGVISPDASIPTGLDQVQIAVDTRDTRNVHRATRFCHRFVATVTQGKGKALDSSVVQKTIARAIADAPLARAGAILSRAERIVSGYRLELFLPAEVLNGFDPETNRRLGLTYHVSDPDRGSQFMTIGREFPLFEDPSLWATLVLSD